MCALASVDPLLPLQFNVDSQKRCKNLPIKDKGPFDDILATSLLEAVSRAGLIRRKAELDYEHHSALP